MTKRPTTDFIRVIHQPLLLLVASTPLMRKDAVLRFEIDNAPYTLQLVE